MTLLREFVEIDARSKSFYRGRPRVVYSQKSSFIKFRGAEGAAKNFDYLLEILKKKVVDKITTKRLSG